ncbi:hypothetical protein RJT34_07776 [Clitoria ternatea]|uniref:Uncharacterized protein n=1 Tax=Clitoria ternatea TaxID=43366 RepID=A0AAN9K675_CLITE
MRVFEFRGRNSLKEGRNRKRSSFSLELSKAPGSSPSSCCSPSSSSSSTQRCVEAEWKWEHKWNNVAERETAWCCVLWRLGSSPVLPTALMAVLHEAWLVSTKLVLPSSSIRRVV